MNAGRKGSQKAINDTYYIYTASISMPENCANPWKCEMCEKNPGGFSKAYIRTLGRFFKPH